MPIYASLTDPDLVTRLVRMKAFHRTETPFSLFIGDGDYGAENKSCIMNESCRNLVELLEGSLPGRDIIELGPGQTAERHEQILKERFGVRSYRGVDIASHYERKPLEESDALIYLSAQPQSSAICLACGVLNEPVSGDSYDHDGLQELRQEYGARLSHEIYRVGMPGLSLFGAGISRKMTSYLLASGFEHHRFETMSETEQDDFNTFCNTFFFDKPQDAR